MDGNPIKPLEEQDGRVVDFSISQIGTAYAWGDHFPVGAAQQTTRTTKVNGRKPDGPSSSSCRGSPILSKLVSVRSES